MSRKLPLIVWLLDDLAADVNMRAGVFEWTANHWAGSLDMMTALLDRGADPTLADKDGLTPLMHQVIKEYVDLVKCLLYDPRVRAAVDAQDREGYTALYCACFEGDGILHISIIRLLLQAGANPLIAAREVKRPLHFIRPDHPSHHAIVALFADAEKGQFLVREGRLVVAANTNASVPSFLQRRFRQGQPLPSVALAPVPVADGEEGRKFRYLSTMMKMLLNMERANMPPELFRKVIDLVNPSWDPVSRAASPAWGRRCRASEKGKGRGEIFLGTS